MIKKLNLRSDFVKYVVVLMSGTAFAQIIAYLLSPIVSRLYTPEEFAELGLFIRIVSVGAAIATLRYEPAFPMLKTDLESFRLYRFAMRITIGATVVSLIAIVVPMALSSDLSAAVFFALMPIALLFYAVYNMGTNWAIRRKYFRSISYSKVTNSLVAGLLKILFGWMKVGYVGLLLATAAGIILANIWFVRDFFRAKKEFRVSARSKRNFLIAREYKEFPTINLPHVLLDLGRDLVIAVLIVWLFSREQFGLYDQSYRMLRLPLVLAGLAIGQVFFQRCAEKLNKQEDILPLLLKSVRLLTAISIVPFAIVFFFGEEMFAFVFGENWRSAGTYSEIMTIWFMLNFITSPVSQIPMLLRRQKEFFKMAIFDAVMIFCCITIPPIGFDASIETTLWILSVSQACYLVFVIFKIFDYSKKHYAR